MELVGGDPFWITRHGPDSSRPLRLVIGLFTSWLTHDSRFLIFRWHKKILPLLIQKVLIKSYHPIPWRDSISRPSTQFFVFVRSTKNFLPLKFYKPGQELPVRLVINFAPRGKFRPPRDELCHLRLKLASRGENSFYTPQFFWRVKCVHPYG
jgi:hypothetical protein